MALDRTWLNSLVDDTGTGTTGTVWNKSAVTHVYDDVDVALAAGAAPASVACLLALASLPTLLSGSLTYLPWDTEISDPLNMHTGALPERITIPAGKAGIYLVSFQFTFNDSTSGARMGQTLLNRVVQNTVWITPPTPANVVSCALSAPIICAAGDYIEVQAYQSSGANLALTGQPRFSAVRIG
jgi:hypothetical protein